MFSKLQNSVIYYVIRVECYANVTDLTHFRLASSNNVGSSVAK